MKLKSLSLAGALIFAFAFFGLSLFPTLMSVSADIKAEGKTYYISSSEGNDSSDGMSETSAWKSFKNINNLVLKAGDSVLLKRGDEWNERLEILGQGTAESPVLISSYGDANAAKPLIRLYNSKNDIGILVKDFYEKDGKAVESPIRHITIDGLSVSDAQLGIYVRVYMTSGNNGLYPDKKNEYLTITNCDFNHITSDIMEELMAYTNEQERIYNGDLNAEERALVAKNVQDKTNELHSSVKGNLPTYIGTSYQSTGGGVREYIFPCAVMIGGKQATVTDATKDTFGANLECVTLSNLKISDAAAGIMNWYWGGNNTTGHHSYKESLKNVRIENILCTGVYNGAIGFDSVDGGASFNAKGNGMQEYDGWGVVRNLRVLAGNYNAKEGWPLGTTGVIVNNCQNFLFEYCEFAGITNNDRVDGCGFDFERNCLNFEISNCVFHSNDDGAILIMDSTDAAAGPGWHENLFIKNNLIYGNLRNPYMHRYSWQWSYKNCILNIYKGSYGTAHENVVFDNNVFYMPTTCENTDYKGQTVKYDVELISAGMEDCYTFHDTNRVFYLKRGGNGYSYKEYKNTYSVAEKDGVLTLEDNDLNGMIFNRVWIRNGNLQNCSGKVSAVCLDGTVLHDKVFDTNEGIIDFAELFGASWARPIRSITVRIDNIDEEDDVILNFISDSNIQFSVRDKQVTVKLSGAAAPSFHLNLGIKDIDVSALGIEVESVRKTGYDSAVIQLKSAPDKILTEKIENENAIVVLPSAYIDIFEELFSGIESDGTENLAGYYGVNGGLKTVEEKGTNESKGCGALAYSGGGLGCLAVTGAAGSVLMKKKKD